MPPSCRIQPPLLTIISSTLIQETQAMKLSFVYHSLLPESLTCIRITVGLKPPGTEDKDPRIGLSDGASQ